MARWYQSHCTDKHVADASPRLYVWLHHRATALLREFDAQVIHVDLSPDRMARYTLHCAFSLSSRSQLFSQIEHHLHHKF